MSSISVIIPNFNRANLIGDTIENMLSQTIAPGEVIVVDDGSTDNSREVIRYFGSRVWLIEQENRGPGAARNAGFAASTGEFIQFMDSDDLASRNKFEVQLATIEATGADFAYGPWVRTAISGKEMKLADFVMQGGPLPEGKPMLEWQLGAWCLVFQNCLFRRQILLKAGQYRTDLMPTEDSEYLVRILLADAQPVFTGQCLVFYRAHTQNQITSSGTSARHRADDWTRYWEVVGDEVISRKDTFHASTRMEVALAIYRHNRYCRQQGWPGLKPDSPFSQWLSSIPIFQLMWADYYDRLSRKFTRLPGDTPNSRGLALRPVNEQDVKLAEDIGFKIGRPTSFA